MSLSKAVGNAPVVAMIGMCKNAGKTTAMNRLAAELADGGRAVALTSVGRDGERTDLVTGTAKPPIYLRRGMLCATAAQLLPACDVSRELIALTDFSTPLGPVVIFRARSDGFVELAGPAIMAHMRALRGQLADLGAAVTLIDGALSRRSPASGTAGGCSVLSTGASLHRDMDRVVADTAYVYRLMALPTPAELWDGPEGRFLLTLADGDRQVTDSREVLVDRLKGGRVTHLRLRGALTDALAQVIVASGGAGETLTLIAEDSSKILLSREQYGRLTARGARLEVVQATPVAAVTVNPVSAYGWRFHPAAFQEAMARAVPGPVIDVEEAMG